MIRIAFDQETIFCDTDEFFRPYFIEERVGDALAPVRDWIRIATKSGFSYKDGKQDPGVLSGRPKCIRDMVNSSLKRLRADRIDFRDVDGVAS